MSKFKVGDRVVANNQINVGGVNVGDVGEVVSKSKASAVDGDLIEVRMDGGNVISVFDLRFDAEKSVAKFKVGDRVVANKPVYATVADGAAGVVKSVARADDVNLETLYRVQWEGKAYTLNMFASEIELQPEPVKVDAVANFKVGDRVRVKTSAEGNYMQQHKSGEEFTITKATKNNFGVNKGKFWYDGDKGGTGIWGYNLVAVKPEPKVGDKVRVTNIDGKSNGWVGKTGTLSENTSSSVFPYFIKEIGLAIESLSEVEVIEAAKQEPVRKSKFKVGDRVRVKDAFGSSEGVVKNLANRGDSRFIGVMLDSDASKAHVGGWYEDNLTLIPNPEDVLPTGKFAVVQGVSGTVYSRLKSGDWRSSEGVRRTHSSLKYAWEKVDPTVAPGKHKILFAGV